MIYKFMKFNFTHFLGSTQHCKGDKAGTASANCLYSADDKGGCTGPTVESTPWSLLRSSRGRDRPGGSCKWRSCLYCCSTSKPQQRSTRQSQFLCPLRPL